MTGQPAPKVIKRAFRFQAVQAFHVTPSVRRRRIWCTLRGSRDCTKLRAEGRLLNRNRLDPQATLCEEKSVFPEAWKPGVRPCNPAHRTCNQRGGPETSRLPLAAERPAMAAAPLAVVPAPESPAESPAVADEEEEEEAPRLDSAQTGGAR